jgi:hypothetical protein
MEAELGLYRPENLPDLTVEYDLIEFFNHLPRAKLAQRTTLITGRAEGMFLCYGSKIGPRFDLGLEIFTCFLTGH